jgi:hypothetical protein
VVVEEAAYFTAARERKGEGQGQGEGEEGS